MMYLPSPGAFCLPSHPQWVPLKSSQRPLGLHLFSTCCRPCQAGSRSHYHFCPGKEKQRSETAQGEPTRESLKYQRYRKQGWNIRSIFLARSSNRKLSKRFGQWSHKKGSKCCWQEEGLNCHRFPQKPVRAHKP